MPLATETTTDCQGIIHIGSGVVTGEEIVKASHAALELVRNTQNFHYEFVDLTDATGAQVADEHLDQVTAQDRLAATFRPTAVVVIAAPRDDLFALSKKWQGLVQSLGWSTHVARDRTDALRWLSANFPPPPAEKLDAEITSATSVNVSE